ncbi:MAG: type VI secretion system tip protein VgrG, partial [Pyrinomonadaceae bacterium]|nr:type VI secretion system tip protein VgrG [Phycisphaerales bacterium]
MGKLAAQARRNMAISTPLGKDVLLLETFTYNEEVARPFSMVAAVTSATPRSVDVEHLLGKPTTIRMMRKDRRKRYFNGIVSRVVQNQRIKDRPQYELTIVPKFWLLTRSSDCRIFQKKSVPQIVAEVFKEHNIDDSLSDRLKARYVKHDFLVQYRETSFNFLSRLMEMEGIYYYFEHTQQGHQLVLADDTSCHRALPGYDQIPFHPRLDAPAPDRIFEWRGEAEITTAQVGMRAFDFKAPNTQPNGSKDLNIDGKVAGSEIFDYPVEFHIPADAGRFARLRAEELAANAKFYYAQTDCRGINVGGTFKLTDPIGQLRKSQVRKYTVVGVSLSGAVTDYVSGNGIPGEEFTCAFRCIQASRVYRPPRSTPRPVVSGSQTATVVGPAGDEIHTDKYGRVKLQFHWDRHGKSDQDSSCWVRVSQPWAGKGFGGIQIPRIGQEIIVDFLEGDPDRPIIIGRVYNAGNMPPVSAAGRDASRNEVNPTNMIEAAMQMTLRSNSLGGSGGHNEITMHDSGGAEKLFLKAQKDEVHLVQNDRKDTVLNDENREVVNNRTRKVGNNEKI